MNAVATETTHALVAADPQTESRQEMVRAADAAMGFTSAQGFELMQRAAKLLSSSTLVPQHYQGNIPNCVIALNMAQRIGADPMQVMQNLYIVHGNPGWSAQFLISTFNQCGRFSALRYEFVGKEGTDEWGCRAYATEKSTGEKLVGATVTIGLAKAEGWHGKNGSKWKTMPQQMLMYRAGSWFVRAYAPELSMGLQTTDELHDIGKLPAQTVTSAAADPKVLQQLDQELAGGDTTDAPEATPDTDAPIDHKAAAQEIHDAIVGAKDRKELDKAGVRIAELPEDMQGDLEKLYDDQVMTLAGV